jgi:hypothetical protein
MNKICIQASTLVTKKWHQSQSRVVKLTAQITVKYTTTKVDEKLKVYGLGQREGINVYKQPSLLYNIKT